MSSELLFFSAGKWYNGFFLFFFLEIWQIIAPQNSCIQVNILSYFSTKSYIVGTHKKCFSEIFVMSTQNL